MAKNSLKFYSALQEAVLIKKIQLYGNCCYTEQWQNVLISSTTWRWARLVHNVTSSHMSISVKIPTLFLPHFKFQGRMCLYLDSKIFHVQLVLLLKPRLPARTCLSCREPLFVSDCQVCDFCHRKCSNMFLRWNMMLMLIFRLLYLPLYQSRTAGNISQH